MYMTFFFAVFFSDGREKKALARSFVTDRTRVYLAVHWKCPTKNRKASAGFCMFFGEDNALNESLELSGTNIQKGEAQLAGWYSSVLVNRRPKCFFTKHMIDFIYFFTALVHLLSKAVDNQMKKLHIFTSLDYVRSR